MFIKEITRADSTDSIEQARIQRAAEVLKTVAHPVRLRIVELLEHGEKGVTEIKELLGLTQPLTSQHLTQMRIRGVLGTRREGAQVYYSIANQDVVKVIHCIRRG